MHWLFQCRRSFDQPCGFQICTDLDDTNLWQREIGFPFPFPSVYVKPTVRLVNCGDDFWGKMVAHIKDLELKRALPAGKFHVRCFMVRYKTGNLLFLLRGVLLHVHKRVQLL